MDTRTPCLRVILGLGNPGLRYRHTRHNLGYRVIDRLGKRWSLRLRRKDLARIGLHHWRGQRVILAKPTLFMNDSGLAADFISRAYRYGPSEFLILMDDTVLPLGGLRVRKGGRDGGHKGLRSVLEMLNTERVPRLRLGAAPMAPPGDISQFVLERFDPEEVAAVEEMVSAAADCVEMILERGLDTAMNEFNRKPVGT